MYKQTAGCALVVGALVAPLSAHAAVVINEIAWMGTATSANAEWIELANTDSTPVNLSGWTLTSSSGTPSTISLTGTIAANGFYLLERTSDSSVPDVSADQIYSGSLANTGLTLTLKDATGTVSDTVVGGTDWKSIGGDNTSKQTPQRNGSAWVTAVATPRAQNATGSSSGTSSGTATTTEDSATPQPSVGGSPLLATATFSNPIPRLRLQVGSGRIVASGARVPYSAHAYDEYGNIRTDGQFTWNFGDGDVAYGREVEHTYAVPGTYLVIIHVTAGPSSVSTTLTVRADPVAAHIVSVDTQGVTVANDGDGILDLSSWKLVAGDVSFTFPPYTALLPHGVVTFAPAVTGIAASTTVATLAFPSGVTVATSSPVALTEPQVEPEVSDVIPAQPMHASLGIQPVGKTPSQLEGNEQPAHEEATSAPSAPVDPGVLGASVGSLTPLATSPWTASFFGLLLAAGAALVIL